MDIRLSRRVGKLPPYLFADLDRRRKEARARGVDVIDLGVGDPDLPTPGPIVETLAQAARDPRNHRYPDYRGLPEFREAAAEYMAGRFGLKVDPASQVCALIGSKEGIFHLPIGLIDPGEAVLTPEPGYPVYRAGTLLAGGEPIAVPLLRRNGFLPDLASIPKDALDRARLMFINYPNNPTGATAEIDFYARTVDFAVQHGIPVASDAAYVEMGFDGYIPTSFLQADGAMEVGIEFHSLSKTFNMTGWRIGFAVGNELLIDALAKVKTNADSGAFNAIQRAAIAALRSDFSWVRENMEVYRRRRDLVVSALDRLGLKPHRPRASFYVWFECPQGIGSAQFSARLLDEAGVVVTPGSGFGLAGEGYCRIALTVSEDRLGQAVERIKGLSF